MALQQKLERFNKQQEKNQALLKTVAQSKQAAPKKAPVAARPPVPSSQTQQPPLTQRLSFRNDTEQLQRINNIRNAPVASQMKRVIDLLFDTRQALTLDEINETCFVDVKKNKAVFDGLKDNVKVSFDGERFAYKSKHDLKNKEDLLRLIRKYVEGISTGDVKDAYPNILKDLQELKASGQVWLLMNSDSQEDIAYPNDPKIQIKVDEDVRELIRSIEKPREFVDVERELQKVGMKPATNTARRKATAGVLGSQQKKPKAKKPRNFNRTKLTNAHLPELFQNMQAPNG